MADTDVCLKGLNAYCARRSKFLSLKMQMPQSEAPASKLQVLTNNSLKMDLDDATAIMS